MQSNSVKTPNELREALIQKRRKEAQNKSAAAKSGQKAATTSCIKIGMTHNALSRSENMTHGRRKKKPRRDERAAKLQAASVEIATRNRDAKK